MQGMDALRVCTKPSSEAHGDKQTHEQDASLRTDIVVVVVVVVALPMALSTNNDSSRSSSSKKMERMPIR